MFYEYGTCGVKDIDEAFKYYKLSAEQGYVGGQFQLGKTYIIFEFL